MNINIINLYQGQQNAIRPSGGKISVANSGPVRSSGESSGGIVSRERDTLPGQIGDISASIHRLQGEMDDLNVVHDPPFFPIATYQRIDLISKVRGIQEAIGQSSLPQEVKQAVSVHKLKENATDKEIGDAIGKLFAVHNTLKRVRNMSAKNIKPGPILPLKA